jgi:SAM-dependent methyltransferase
VDDVMAERLSSARERRPSPSALRAAMTPTMPSTAGRFMLARTSRLQDLARDAIALLTGRPPEVRNRIKFFLLSPIYDGFYRVVPMDPHHEIERRLLPGTHRVLDLCTGTALVPAVLATHPDVFVVGLDLSPEMLAMGRAKLARAGRANAALVRADAAQLPFRDRTFDAVTVSFGLHELPTAVRECAVHETARVLRHGGVLVVADLDRPPRFGWLVDAYLRIGEPAHAREVTGDGLARLLRGAGFAVEREGPHGAVPMQMLVARLEAHSATGRAARSQGSSRRGEPAAPPRAGVDRRLCHRQYGGYEAGSADPLAVVRNRVPL